MNVDACAGCQWKDLGQNGSYCYMFESAPKILPCAQHDKFTLEREIMSRMISKYPVLLGPMIINYDENK